MQTKLCAKRLIKTNHQDPTTSEPALTDAKSNVAPSDKRDNSVRNRVKPSETSCLVHKNATSINGRTNQNIEFVTVECQGRRCPKEVSSQGQRTTTLQAGIFAIWDNMLGRFSSWSLLPQFAMEPPRVLRSRRGEQTHRKLLIVRTDRGITKTSVGDNENNPWPRRMVTLRYGEGAKSRFTGKHVRPEASKAARHFIAVPWMKTGHLQQHGQNTAEQAALLRPPKLSRHSLEEAVAILAQVTSCFTGVCQVRFGVFCCLLVVG